MVARVERKGHAIHTCKKCGCTDDDHGDWFWSNALCDQCSTCFPPSGIVIDGGRVLSPVPDTIQADRAYYARRLELATEERQMRGDIKMLDPIKLSLTRNKGPHGVLLLAVVARAVEDIKSFENRRKGNRKITVGRYNDLLLQAKAADSWLMGDTGSRLTLRMVALYHDMEVSYLREKIYQQWDESFIERLRKLTTMKSRTVDTVCDEGSDDDA
jgi:hypothetical protein